MKEQTKVKEIRDNIQDYLDNEYNEDIDILSDEFKEKLIMAFLEPVLSTISDNLIEKTTKSKFGRSNRKFSDLEEIKNPEMKPRSKSYIMELPHQFMKKNEVEVGLDQIPEEVISTKFESQGSMIKNH